MLQLKGLSCNYFALPIVFVVFLLIFTSFALGAACCNGGKISQCPNLGNGQSYDLSGCMAPIGPDITIDPPIHRIECVSGSKQYRPVGECYTETNTCCSDDKWSGFGKLCSFVVCKEKNPCTSDSDCCGGKTCPLALGVAKRICSFSSIVEPPSDCVPVGKKPECTLSNGNCWYVCSCENNQWSNCQKSESCNTGYEPVRNSNGSLCYENINCNKQTINGFLYPCYCAKMLI